LIARVEGLGWPVAQAAAMQGISRATGYKWLRRYRAEGDLGLLDRSSRPRRSPRALPPDQAQVIVAARVERRWGPHRLAPLTGHPRSTIYATLRRAGLSRLPETDRPTGIPVRYQACHPGALLHQDHKKLGRVPDGGGHRIHGWQPGRRKTGLGYDHVEVVIDDRSRVAFVVPVPDDRPASAARALELAATEFARLGVRIERVLTDNGGPYRSDAYAATLAELGSNVHGNHT
jgi:transposase